VKIQLRKRNGIYRIQGNRELEHNHPLLTSDREDIPGSIQETVKDLLKVGMDKSRILAFIHLRTARVFSRLQLAVIDSQDLPMALATNTDVLLEHMYDKGECRIITLEADGELKRAAIFRLTVEERRNLERFGEVVFLDGTAVRNPLGWTTYPITLVDDEKTLLSGGLLFTAYEREDMFEWLLDALNEIIVAVLRTIFVDEDSALIPATTKLRTTTRHDVAHRICVFHKSRKFVKHANASGATAIVREQATKLLMRSVTQHPNLT
jgi:hypothetical protein